MGFPFFEAALHTRGPGAETHHSPDYGEFPQQRPQAREAVAVSENSWANKYNDLETSIAATFFLIRNPHET